MSSLITLHECVLNALDLFISKPLPSVKLPTFKRPLVVGSGNAAITGKVLFSKYDAIYADESSYQQLLASNPAIDGAVVISASGGKHAPKLVSTIRATGKEVVLFTNTPDSPASQVASSTFVFPKNPEPYTYNTSTYMGMMLSLTHEDPATIKEHILTNIAPQIPANFSTFDAFYILVPDMFSPTREMLVTKFDELFGAKVSGRVFTPSQTMHAKTVVPSDTELFISLGVENTTWGNHRCHFELPPQADFATFMAISYYIIGHIQAQHPPYFMDNIEAYTQYVSKMFGQNIQVIS